MPKQKYIKIVIDYINFLKSKGLVFDKYYLFGSCVRGSNTKDSDIDILLISNCFLFPNDKEIDYLHNITKKYNNTIGLFLLSTYKFNFINPEPCKNYFSICSDHIHDIHYPIFTEINNKLPQYTSNHKNIA